MVRFRARFPFQRAMSKGRFYFSIFRLMALWSGQDPSRSESNQSEALLVGSLVYLVHYLFLATVFLPSNLRPLPTALLLIALAFAVWIFWLLLIYVGSLILRALGATGLFRTMPARYAQSILWGLVTTTMAWALLRHSAILREIGAIWLVAITLNLGSALALVIIDARRSS